MNLKVGDVVVIRYSRSGRGSVRADRGTVTKIGRRWATVNNDSARWPDSFMIDKETGFGKPYSGGQSAGYVGRTEEEWALQDERRAYTEAIIEKTGRTYWLGDLTIEQLKAIAKTIGAKPTCDTVDPGKEIPR